ncbi:MAG: D-tyrosyl-tRNA(Tyr) deacylase [Clostridia bacterium]|nr:D-tyrosyl-tRNA(Tyr) deacylase [Clostridia bacterium]
MRAVVQRVRSTRLSVDGALVSEIPFGLAVYLGVKVGDTEADSDYIAKKISLLRIFSDEQGKMNLSVKDVGGEVLLISQFTLYGDCTHGNRPSFITAERPERADVLYEHTAAAIRSYGIPVKTGIFGADMKIEQYNDGPVTIIMESQQ